MKMKMKKIQIFQKIRGILTPQKTVEEDADIDEIIKMMSITPVDDRQSIEKVELKSENDVNVVIEKLSKEKIVIVDFSPLIRRKEILKNLVKRLNESCENMKGQICRISNEMVIVTPQNIRIGITV